VLALVTSVSANVHKTMRRSPYRTRPGVDGWSLVRLTDVLNGLVPGYPMADLAIQEMAAKDERRREERARARDLRGGHPDLT